ncbi:MAG: HD domain-containing protein [Myxococcales bacterium]|nr:HD domain-containing protein [Myxococcales bacterium]
MAQPIAIRMIPGRAGGRKNQEPLLAPSHYIRNLARAAESLDVTLLEDTALEAGNELKSGALLDRATLERLASQCARGRLAPRCSVGQSLHRSQLAERVRNMLKRQSDVRQMHERSGFGPPWDEIERQVEVPANIGSLLSVISSVRPALFSQGIMGGYLAAMLAWEMRMSVADRVTAFLAGLVRDVGMLYADLRILDDPTDKHFDGDAWTAVQTHVVVGARIVGIAGMPSAVKNAVLCHHERVDSTGYPRALWGGDLPIIGQLVGFADIVSTLRIKRFFGSGRNLRDTMTILQLNMDSFDSRIGKAFTEILGRCGLNSTSFCPHDRETMLKLIKRRAGVIRSSMLQLQEVTGDRRAKNRSPQGHTLRGSVERTLANLMASGHSDTDFVWWLGLVAAGKERADMHQLAEIDLQQEELLWQLRRVRQELFKVVPSLNYKSNDLV